MCLAVPMRVLEVLGETATVDLGGITRTINISFMEDVRPGEYVIVHAGFAIQKLDEKQAEETLELFREIL